MQQKEGTPTFHNSMDGTGEHYAKWNKPDGERQIPYNLMYKWNLVNTTKSKQAKYNQRHWNKEQTDSNHWGGEGGSPGKERKGLWRNMYKGPMDKAKRGKDWGWEVGVSGVG